MPSKTFRAEGLQACVLVLEYAAAATGDAELIRRAKGLEDDLKSSWVPSFLVSSRADDLAADIAPHLGGTDPRDLVDTGGNPYAIHNAPDSDAAKVGGFDPSTADQHAQFDEGIAGKLSLAGRDIADSARELKDKLAPTLSTTALVVGALAVAALFFWIYVNRRRGVSIS